MNFKFTLIISIYRKITLREIARSLNSLRHQQFKPTQIIITFDGYCSNLLKEYVVNFFKSYSKNKDIIYIQNNTNRGIHYCYNNAIKKSKNDLIAIQDSDDESSKDRFKFQVRFFNHDKKLSILGGYVVETYNNKQIIKKVPLKSFIVKLYFHFKNPINHPTVMFRKSHLLKTGLYSECKRMEDYFLWIKSVSKGLTIKNIPKILSKTYVDDNFFLRRSSRTILFSELKIQKLLLKNFKEHFIVITFILPFKIIYHFLPANFKLYARTIINSLVF